MVGRVCAEKIPNTAQPTKYVGETSRTPVLTVTKLRRMSSVGDEWAGYILLLPLPTASVLRRERTGRNRLYGRPRLPMGHRAQAAPRNTDVPAACKNHDGCFCEAHYLRNIHTLVYMQFLFFDITELQETQNAQ